MNELTTPQSIESNWKPSPLRKYQVTCAKPFYPTLHSSSLPSYETWSFSSSLLLRGCDLQKATGLSQALSVGQCLATLSFSHVLIHLCFTVPRAYSVVHCSTFFLHTTLHSLLCPRSLSRPQTTKHILDRFSANKLGFHPIFPFDHLEWTANNFPEIFIQSLAQIVTEARFLLLFFEFNWRRKSKSLLHLK